MTRPLRNLRAAGEEFAAAVRWYEEQRLGLGADFYDQVVYRLLPNEIVISAVAHLKRRPGYWLTRT